jgi:hypothetical protein
VGQPLTLIEAVIPEGHPTVHHGHRQQPAPSGPRVATHLEDVRAIGTELELDPDRRRPFGMVDDPDVLLHAGRPGEPVTPDPDGPPGELIQRVDLGVRVAIRGRVRHLDLAAIVATDRGLQQDRPATTDAQDRAGEDPRVAAVQPETARVWVDVAEGVAQEVVVGVLEDLDRAEVRRPGDRDVPDGVEPDVGRVRRHRRPPVRRPGARPGRP